MADKRTIKLREADFGVDAFTDTGILSIFECNEGFWISTRNKDSRSTGITIANAADLDQLACAIARLAAAHARLPARGDQADTR